jgi:hypothetical protein
MNEVLPILYGTLAGLCCAKIRVARRRTALWVVLSLLCGVAATLVSGEFKFGWEFLFIDIPLAGGAALGVIMLCKFARPRSVQ